MAEVDGLAAFKSGKSKDYDDNYERIFGHSAPKIDKKTKKYNPPYISVEAKIAERIDYIPPKDGRVGAVVVKDPRGFKTKLTMDDFR